jgi:DNA-binding MarR family transcriptional regulator
MTEPSKKLNLEDYFPSQLATLSNSITRPIAAVFEEHFSISMPEWRVLAIVGRRPGLSAVDVAQSAHMDKVAVSRAISKLVQNGYVDRGLGSVDRRRLVLNLSECGEELYEKIAPLALLLETELLEDLTPDEKEILERVIDKLSSKSRVFARPHMPPTNGLRNSHSRPSM